MGFIYCLYASITFHSFVLIIITLYFICLFLFKNQPQFIFYANGQQVLCVHNYERVHVHRYISFLSLHISLYGFFSSSISRSNNPNSTLVVKNCITTAYFFAVARFPQDLWRVKNKNKKIGKGKKMELHFVMESTHECREPDTVWASRTTSRLSIYLVLFVQFFLLPFVSST